MRENNMCYRIWFIFVIYLQVEEGKIIMFGGAVYVSFGTGAARSWFTCLFHWYM